MRKRTRLFHLRSTKNRYISVCQNLKPLTLELHMLNKIKYIFAALPVIALVAWIGTTTFNYFTHSIAPEISFIGLAHHGSYGGTLSCAIKSTGTYKVKTLHAWLDGKEFDLGDAKYIRAQHFEAPIKCDLTNLENGQHTFEVEAQDSSYHQNKAREKVTFYVDNLPLKAEFLEPRYTVEQGKTLHLKIQANKQLAKARVSFLAKDYCFYPESEHSTLYECFIPIDCEEKALETAIQAEVVDAVSNSLKLSCNVQVKPFAFKKQRGFTVSDEKLEQEKEVSMNTKILRDSIEKWIQDSPRKKLWNGPFEYPIEVQRVTTPFGEVRTTPQRGRYHHKGLDLVNQPRAVVWAAQHGRVIIKDRFLMTGNTIVLDHGLGIFTLYAHLEDFAEVHVGDIISKGNPIGRLGKTGYASGYHLHWEMLVQGVQVDPVEWTSNIH